MSKHHQPAAPAGSLERYALGIWAVFLALALWFLHLIGSGDLAAPPLASPAQFTQWINTVGAASAVMAVVRLLALVAAWYLVMATMVGAIAREANSSSVVTATNRMTPKFLRRIFTSAGGLTLSAAGLAVAVSPLLAPDAANPVVTQIAAASDSHGAQVGPDVRVGNSDDATLEEVAGPAGSNTTTEGSASLSEMDFKLAPLGSERVENLWLVEQGDHLWSISADTLAEAWGRQPTDAQVAPYWAQVIEINQSNLVDPGNPDLLFPGQLMTLPPVPSMPSAPVH